MNTMPMANAGSLIAALMPLIHRSPGALHLKSVASFFNKYMIWFWLSAFLLFINVAYQKMLADALVIPMIASLLCEILSTFCLTTYLLFRGIFVISQVSKHGEKHLAYLTVRKLTQHPLLTYCLIAILSLFAHAGRIYVVWVCWCIRN